MPFTYRNKEKEEGKSYVQNKTIPQRIKNARDKNNFKKKWDGITIYQGKYFKDGREIIFKEDIEYGFVGRDKLYPKIREKYLNISLGDVNAFLKNHETNQVHLPRQTVVASRPVRTRKANSVWYADLIIINKKKSKKKGVRQFTKLDKVILTVVDAFSKFAWVRVIDGAKDSKRVSEEFEHILKQEAPNTPNMLHTDNGGEFKKHFDQLLKRYKILHRFSRPNTPSDAAIVERFNRTIKTMWARYTTQTGDDSVTNIQKLVTNYNSNVHSSTKKRPIDLHPNKKNEDVDKRDIRTARRQIDKRIKKSVAREKALYPDKIEVGDYVRIDFKIDEGLKENIFRKKYLRQWSFRIFKVIKVSRPNGYKNPFYTIQFENSDPVRRRFYRHEMLKIDKSNLLRPLNTIAEASMTLKHNPKDQFDFFHLGVKVVDAQQYKARKTKTNQFGYVWELTFEGIPNKQFIHPQRAKDSGKEQEV